MSNLKLDKYISGILLKAFYGQKIDAKEKAYVELFCPTYAHLVKLTDNLEP